MIEIMRNAKGAGIAATQIGVDLSIFIAEVKENPRYPYKPNLPLTVVINPEIEYIEDLGTHFVYEGCLSVPGLRGKAKRYLGVKLRSYDRDGNSFEKEYRGLTAV